MDSILSIRNKIRDRVKSKRKAMKLSQEELAKRSGVSFGSVKRFEGTGEISLTSLLKIAIVLESEDDFDSLFMRKSYQSLQEVIDEAKQ
ncbi:MAG: helix-turn-helix domain-containing protein [Alphaproteobacteria bacterium]|nr:helix-turn-helix domain-containing protein [Alphaproteobacteria bacterium]